MNVLHDVAELLGPLFTRVGEAAPALDLLGAALDAIQKAGLIGLLLFFIIGGQRGWWIFGREYDAVREERDTWKQIALDNLGLQSKTVDVLEKAATRLPAPRTRRPRSEG